MTTGLYTTGLAPTGSAYEAGVIPPPPIPGDGARYLPSDGFILAFGQDEFDELTEATAYERVEYAAADYAAYL